MKAAELFVRCLENEGVEYIFGIPGEENIDIMDALLDSRIKFITTRHEQGAAFMADVYGRLTGRAGVCMATLGPGATNLITGFADANMDRAPIVGHRRPGCDDPSAQGKSSDPASREPVPADHQVRDADPRARDRARDRAQGVQGGADGKARRRLHRISREHRRSQSRRKPYRGANGLHLRCARRQDRAGGQDHLRGQAPDHPRRQRRDPPGSRRLARSSFAEMLRIPVANSFMAKGVVPFSKRALARHDRAQGARSAVVSRSRKPTWSSASATTWSSTTPTCGIPTTTRRSFISTPCRRRWTRTTSSRWASSATSARRCAHRAEGASRSKSCRSSRVRKAIIEDRAGYANDLGFPVKPQKIVWDLREVLGPEDIAISDVGAHKMWMARMYRAERPNTCIISNGFAAMGIAVPGRNRREARLSRTQGHRRNRRRRLHDELAGDRDRDADEDAIRDPDLERLRVRAHHLASAAPFRPPQPHRVQESRLRQIRRKLRRQGLPRGACGGSRPHPQARAGRTRWSRSSTALSTTPKT